MRTIGETIRLLERNQMMSPNEMGQFVERETSATEVQQVSSTSGDLHSYKSSGIDEARQAQKIILYESLLACGCKKVKVSVPERYPNEVIKALGFSIEPSGLYEQDNATGLNLIGTKDSLTGEYVFNSRDGAERTSNTESAKVLMELMRYILSSEMTFKAFVQAFGMEQVTKSLSEIFRLAGSPMTLKLPVNFDEDEMTRQLGDDPAEARKKIIDALTQIDERLKQVEGVAEDYVSQEQVKQEKMGIAPPGEGSGAPMPQQAPATSAPQPQMPAGMPL